MNPGLADFRRANRRISEDKIVHAKRETKESGKSNEYNL